MPVPEWLFPPFKVGPQVKTERHMIAFLNGRTSERLDKVSCTYTLRRTSSAMPQTEVAFQFKSPFAKGFPQIADDFYR
jgi:hypothetical protein